MDYVIYRRVSTEEQGSSGLGLEAQQTAVKRFLKVQGGQLIDSYSDIQSGSKDDREGLNKALRSCRFNKASLIVSKLCRLSRSFSYSAKLLDQDVPIVVAENPYASMLELRLKAAINQEERERISTRTKEALAEKASKGDILGNPEVYKYAKNQNTGPATQARMEQANDYKEIMKDLIIQEFGEELPSLSVIADWLNESGYETPRGKTFTRAAVQRILSI